MDVKPSDRPCAPVRAEERIVVGVVIRREPVPGPMARWQPWRWTLADVQVLQGPQGIACAQWPTLTDRGPVALEPCEGPASAAQCHWGFAGYAVSLHPEDAEGLYLNLTAPRPCFWVMWRPGETDDDVPEPQIVTLSYHDAGRWLDAQERVDQVPAPADVIGWMARFVQQHYRPEPKRRARPASFQPLTDRFGQPARISTGVRAAREEGT